MIKSCPYCNMTTTGGHKWDCPAKAIEGQVPLVDVRQSDLDIARLKQEVEALKKKIEKILDYLGVEL